MDRLKQQMLARNIEFSELATGDLFLRRGDGQGMYVRADDEGTFDWCVNVARNDLNLMDFRKREQHDLDEVLRRIDDFLGSIVFGDVVIDTLGLVRQSMAQGMTRQEAENAAAAARNFAQAMHASGMDASEIRNRFAEIHEQLRRERTGETMLDRAREGGRR
ncbi:MAG: hypothetical protein HC829_06745 [Bacteroidales bacterium]|nr:hypothetical protein [Bacteroidales bacterium]